MALVNHEPTDNLNLKAKQQVEPKSGLRNQLLPKRALQQ